MSVQGHLVSIKSPEENTFILDALSSPWFWIGGTYQSSQWTWSDGTQWNFDDWHPGQPSGNGNCAMIGRGGRDQNVIVQMTIREMTSPDLEFC